MKALEQAADPFCNAAVVASWQGKPAALALEVADPVEATGYKISNTLVSNFVLPPWFDRALPHPKGWDFCAQLAYACEVQSGGYAQYSRDNSTWQEVLSRINAKRSYRSHPAMEKYSRHHRRQHRGQGVSP